MIEYFNKPFKERNNGDGDILFDFIGKRKKLIDCS